MRVALVSLDQAWEDRQTNLARCAARIRRAAAHGADLVVFPEMTLTGFTMNAAAVAEPAEASPTISAFGELAAQHDVAIAFGVVLLGTVRPRNTLVVVSRTGVELARYAKVHPFTHAREGEAYEAGSRLVTAEVAGVRFGLSICYDLRFGGLYAALAPHVSAFLVIASWPGQRIEHWNALLRARAIETQAFVLGVNRTGADPAGNSYPASTRAFDPRGDSLPLVSEDGDIAVVEISAAATEACRRAFPVLVDSRPDVYRFPPDGDESTA